MRYWQAAVALSATIFLAAPVAAKRKSNPAAVALFNKAIQSSGVQGKGGAPFRLQARVRIFSAAGESDGMAIEFWTPGEARRETLLNGYSRVEVFENGEAWAKSNIKYAPFPATVTWKALFPAGKLRSALRPGSAVPFTPLPEQGLSEKLTLGRPKLARGPKKGPREECVKGTVKGRSQEPSYCFDPATGYLVNAADGDLLFQYSDYQAFGAKVFPRTIRVFYGDGRPFIDLRVVRIDPEPPPPVGTFQPPPGSEEEWDSKACGTGTLRVKPPENIKEPLPRYPSEVRKDGIQGTVSIHAVIGKDGALHAPWLLSSPSPKLSTAAWAAFQQWRYDPATVCGQKVDASTTVFAVFSVRQ